MTSSKVVFKSGYVAILGEPNVGKSTLLNSLLRQKISIVSRKPQTTRHRILGILTGDSFQILFLDTPGLIKPKYLLQHHMMKLVESAIDDANILLFMIDATKPESQAWEVQPELIERTKGTDKTPVLVINKIDRINKSALLPIIDVYSKRFVFHDIVPVSALIGENVADLRKTLVKNLPEHPPYYEADTLSEHPDRFFVSEIIREKLFQKLREEVPYSVTVDILEFKEGVRKSSNGRDFARRVKNGQRTASNMKDFISAEIYVEKDSQKGIIIGKGGRMLKEIGERSRKDIEEFLGRPVFLELHVKVRPNWRDDETWLRRLGY